MKLLILAVLVLGNTALHAQSKHVPGVNEEQVLIKIENPAPMEIAAVKLAMDRESKAENNRQSSSKSRLLLNPYATGGAAITYGAPIDAYGASLDLEMSVGGGLLLEASKGGLFVEATGKAIGKYIMLAGPVGYEAKAGVMFKTKESQGVYIAGVFYRQIGYNNLSKSSLNANIRAVEIGTMRLDNSEQADWFLRAGLVDGTSHSYFGGGMRVYGFKKK